MRSNLIVKSHGSCVKNFVPLSSLVSVGILVRGERMREPVYLSLLQKQLCFCEGSMCEIWYLLIPMLKERNGDLARFFSRAILFLAFCLRLALRLRSDAY